jgi:hypothetical protein
MKLLYIWIENPGKELPSQFSHKGFCFSSKCDFDVEESQDKIEIDYNRTQCVSLREVTQFPDNLMELTGIVGENGTGKTSFLYFIYECLFDQTFAIAKANGCSYISVFLTDQNKLFIFHNLQKNVFVEGKKQKSYFENHDYLSRLGEATIIYFTNSGFVSRPFFAERNSAEEKFIKISLIPDRLRNLRNDIVKDSFMLKNMSPKISQIYNKLLQEQFASSFDNLVHLIFLFHAYSVKDPIRDQIPFLLKFPDLEVAIDNDSSLPKTIIGDTRHKPVVFESLRQLLTKDEQIELKFCDSTLKTVKPAIDEEISSFSSRFGKYFEGGKNHMGDDPYKFKLSYDSKSTEEKEDYLFFLQWLNKNVMNSSVDSYIFPKLHIYSSSFSDGEHGLLNLFSYLFLTLSLKSIHPCKNVFLLIDEVDLYMHPQWQRNIAYYLLTMVSSFKNYNFQIILTTHSPICVSDFPQKNLIVFNTLGSSAKENSFISPFGNFPNENLSYFFLGKDSSPLGEISSIYIDNITSELFESGNPKQLKKSITASNYAKLKVKIGYIGNDMIRKTLLFTLEKIKHDSD